MPTLLKPDAKRARRLEAADRSAEFIARNRSRFRGRFIVVCDGELVAAAADPLEARTAALEAGIALRECIIQYIPDEDSFYFY